VRASLGRLAPPDLPCWPAGAYLVGGAVRDLLIGLRPGDFDFATPRPREAAAACAAAVGGPLFPLDAERGFWRVAGPGVTYDFGPLASDLAAELLRRDYTANALALSRRGALFGPEIALHDVRRGVLRAVSRANLREDALRPLRGWRLWVTRGLRPEPRTRALILAEASYQRFGRRPAAERVRQELEQVMAHRRAAWGFAKLHELGLDAVYLREWAAGAGVVQLGYHHLDVLDHQLEALHQLLTRFPEAPSALRWAALLHDVAKPLVRQWDPERGYYRFLEHDADGAALAAEMLRRLRFSGELARRVGSLVRRHMKLPPASPRGLRRWLHRNRVLLPDLLQLQIADRAATRGPLAVANERRLENLEEALAAATALAAAGSEPPLLRGSDLINELGFAPGPLVGRALRALAEARALGDVTDREEALEFVRWWYETETAGPERPANTRRRRPERPAGD